MAIIKTQGIVLSSKVFFENDKRVELFSKEFGRCILLAKHAVNSKKRFVGRLEPTNHIECLLRTGKSFYLIDHCEIITSFMPIRENLNKIYLASYFFDIIRKVTVSHQQHHTLYALLLETVRAISVSDDLTAIKSFFYRHFLTSEGLLSDQLSSSTKPNIINDHTFKRIFEDYTGKLLVIPELLCQKKTVSLLH